MTKHHEGRAGRVSEPVQVYLAREDRQTLQRLAEHLDLSMSDVIRNALAAYEQSVLSPEAHPSLRIIGIAGDVRARDRYDVAVEHDRFLADISTRDAVAPGQRKPAGRKRGR
jgi:hypothetical protein